MASRLPFRRFRHSLLLPLVKFFAYSARVMPRKLIWVTAGIFGLFASMIPGRSRRIFKINEKHIIHPCGLKVRLSHVYRYIISGMSDFINLNYRSDDEFRRVVEVRGEEHMQAALSLGKGVIAITAHYSAWELIPRAILLLGHKVGIVSRELSHRETSEYFNRLRARCGTELIDRGGGIARLMRVLRDNTAVGILIDQDTLGVDSDFVDFMGLHARTPVGPAQLAVRFGIPVLTLHISRGEGGKYILQIDESLDLSGYEGDKGYLKLTADLTGRIEEWVREDPEQWVWIHERWARRPGWAPGLQ
ncbi:MAG: lysophospholipid acyltransferase family protein [Candidatus Aegiribacteria sp.]|nr:lysophospholipid acyltransferase family protein [Candidatus Aegiribacteria sp.]